jgi:hypothetical protein
MRHRLIKWAVILTGCLFLPLSAWCQSDLLHMLEQTTEKKPQYTTATFKSTRVINLQSVETVAGGALDFRISHRFGKINSGAYNFFGLDQATMRLGFEYGLSDRITIGLGRSSFQKYFDSFLKAKLLRQRKGGGFPFSVVWFSSVGLNSLKFDDDGKNHRFDSRLTYSHQLIVGRKFSERFSLQLSPTIIHRNQVQSELEESDVYALGVGGRIKLSKRMSLNGEYVFLKPGYTADHQTESFSLGVDIETGGHVFQLHVTNSPGMTEQSFVARNTDSWSKGELFYGFNVSRTFTIGKRKQ